MIIVSDLMRFGIKSSSLKHDRLGLLFYVSKDPYTRKRFPAFLYCLLFSRESRTTSSLLETIQKRRKTFPCVRGLKLVFFYVSTINEQTVSWMNVVKGIFVNRELPIFFVWIVKLRVLVSWNVIYIIAVSRDCRDNCPWHEN